MQKKYEIRITRSGPDDDTRARKLFDVNNATVVDAVMSDGFIDYVIEIDDDVFSVLFEALFHSGLSSEVWPFPKAESQERSKRVMTHLHARRRAIMGTTKH